jgi:hypothetical protein
MKVRHTSKDRGESATQHDGTESLAVNDKFIYRFLTILTLKITKPRFYGSHGLCGTIHPRLIVKRGVYAHLTEAATLRFLAEKTSIPVPRVHCAFLHKSRAFIVMERPQGVTLAVAWKSLSDVQRAAISAQIKSIFQELRSLPPPPSVGIESCVGGSLRHYLVSQLSLRFGPFKTIHEFHLWLREEFQPRVYPDREDDQDWQDIKQMVAKQDGPWPPPVFTHGHLHLSNVMVCGDRVSGIINWEFAGWYPHYWEYTSVTSGLYGFGPRHAWDDEILRILDPYPEEL